MNQQVNVITRRGDLLLVEWTTDATHRAWVTPDMVVEASGNEATVHRPEAGIPYGDDLAALLTASISAAEVQSRLHRAGIWTADELLHRPREALGIFHALAGELLQTLLTNARLLQKGQFHEE